MARNQRDATGGPTPRVTVESVGRAAVVAAVFALLASTVVYVLPRIVESADIDATGMLAGQLRDLVGDAALFGAVLAAVVTDFGREVLAWAVVVAYARELLQGIVYVVTVDRADLSAFTLFNPLYSVVTLLAIVVAIRTFRDETVLPWVDLRV